MSGDVHVRFCERPGVRFPRATHLVFAFGREEDARRVLEVLPKRFEKHGLTLHPDKTRLLNFRRPDTNKDNNDKGGPSARTFDLLGFTHFWGRSLRGKWIPKMRTARNSFSRALRRVREWCRAHRHDPVPAQHKALSRKLHGHYGYFGVPHNSGALVSFRWHVQTVWRKWLARRSQAARRKCTWRWMCELLKRLWLPLPRIVHRYNPQLRLPLPV